MARLLWIVLAGGVGTGVRHLVNQWAMSRFGHAFPWGIVLVNLVGCLLMTLLMHVGLKTATFPATLRIALTTGFLGGLTTYSSFNYDTLRLVEEGRLRDAALNFGVTTVGGLVAGLLGLLLARRLVGA